MQKNQKLQGRKEHMKYPDREKSGSDHLNENSGDIEGNRGVIMAEANEKLVIKGQTFGEGMPVLCVTIAEQREEDILRQVKSLTDECIPMIEIRGDFFDGLYDEDRLTEFFRTLSPMVENTVLLFTVRTIPQGGRTEPSASYLQKIYDIAAISGVCDFIDIEYNEFPHPAQEIRRIHECGVRVLTSDHDYMQTAKSVDLLDLLEKMRKAGADMVELAVTPEDPDDLLELLKVTNRFHRSHPDTPVITLSMGEDGFLTRVTGEIFGSAVTFGKAGKSDLNGHVSYKKLQMILNQVHDSLNGNF